MATTPAFTPTEARTRETFLALMWAFSYPGRVQTLPAADPFALIAEALLDLETSYYTPDAALAVRLLPTGARSEPLERAEYIFVPLLANADLESLRNASSGTMAYPDQAATLIIGCVLNTNLGARLHLSGPGIKDAMQISVDALPVAFWELRERTRRYPLGWDIFLVSGSNIIGIPRSTHIERTG